jgi:hypothetical protein
LHYPIGMARKEKTTGEKKWSARVTQEGHALELEEGVFTWNDPKMIARSLSKSAEARKRRKASPFRSAMSMLVFYINRAGKNLDKQQLKTLEQAKVELHKRYGKA